MGAAHVAMSGSPRGTARHRQGRLNHAEDPGEIQPVILRSGSLAKGAVLGQRGTISGGGRDAGGGDGIPCSKQLVKCGWSPGAGIPRPGAFCCFAE